MDCASYTTTPLTNSKWLDEGILNLWVNDDMDERMIIDTCNQIKSLLAEYRRSNDDKL
jgi:hypothetical protein